MGWAPDGRPAGRPDGRPGRTAPEPGPSISNPDDAAAPQPRVRPATTDRPSTAAARDALSVWILGQLLVDPARLQALDSALALDAQPPLGPADFGGAEEQALMAALAHAARGGPAPEVTLDSLPEPLEALALDLVGRAGTRPSLTDDALTPELRWAALRLRKRALERGVTELKYLLQEAEGRRDRSAAASFVDRWSTSREGLRRLTELLMGKTTGI